MMQEEKAAMEDILRSLTDSRVSDLYQSRAKRLASLGNTRSSPKMKGVGDAKTRTLDGRGSEAKA